MRFFILGVLLNAFFALSAQEYCACSAKYDNWEFVKNVSFNSFSNSSEGAGYENFTALESIELFKGENYELNITTGKFSQSDMLEVYIDKNRDSLFSEDEKIILALSGEASKEGNAIYTYHVDESHREGLARMRVVLFDSGSDHSGYAQGCGSFDYGEVEDYHVNVKAINSPPEVDFFADATSIFKDGVVKFSDNSGLLPTLWKWQIEPEGYNYLEQTSSTVQNPVVQFSQSGKYNVTLTASNEYGSSTLTKENFIEVRDFSAPRNLEAESEGSHVDISWSRPNVPGWVAYNYDLFNCYSTYWNPMERGTVFSSKNLPYSYPVTINKLSSGFFYASSNPWPDDHFKFRIRKAASNELVYESDYIEALHAQETVCELDSLLTLIEDFVVSIVSRHSGGMPASLAMAVEKEDCNSKIYDQSANEWTTIAKDGKGLELFIKVGTTHDAVSSSNKDGLVIFPDRNENASLSGYELFFDGELLTIIDNPDLEFFTHRKVGNGEHSYQLKALYFPEGESPLTDPVTVTVDNTDPEFTLWFNNKELRSNDFFRFPFNVEIGKSATMEMIIENEGQNALIIGDITIDNALFTITKAPASSIEAGDSASFELTFTPTADGAQDVKLAINNNDDNDNPFYLNGKAIGGVDRWTWMLYLYEDGTGLDGMKDLNELEVNGSLPGEVNYLVCYDADDDEKDGIWYIEKDENGFNRELVSRKISDIMGADPVMENPATLKKFMDWTLENYPAQHYGLTLWDHGDGIFKSGTTTSDGINKGFVGHMKLWQLSGALKPWVEKAGKPLDIVGFDVCLLGQIETAYQLKGLSKYVIASPLTEPGDGWDYFNAFKVLNANTSLPASELATSICNTFIDSYKPGGSSYVTTATQAVTAVDTLTDVLVPVLNKLADELIKSLPTHKAELLQLKNKCWAAPGSMGNTDNPDHRDLGNLLDYLAASTTMPTAVVTLAGEAKAAYAKTVIANGYSGATCAKSSGLKIWMHEKVKNAGTIYSYYSNPDKYLLFGETNWIKYLEAFQDAEVAVEDFSTKEGFVVYPNPSNGIVSIQSFQNIHQLRVYNTQGKVVLDLGDKPQGTVQAELVPGIYIVSGNTASSVISYKIVIN
jgi:PKD repeat protein